MFKKLFLFTFLMFFCVSGVNANVISQKFDIEVGVFDAGMVEINYNAEKNKYDVSAELKTANFFGNIYPFEARYEAQGIKQKNELVPVVYKNRTKTRNHVRLKEILYNKKGMAYKRISTKDDKRKEVDIKDVPDSADAADLQNVIAELIYQFDKNRSCKLEREVFDGKKHYKVIVDDQGQENRVFDFDGKVRNSYKCSMYIKNLKENNDNILWDVSAERPINIWIDINKETQMPNILEIRIDSTPLGGIKVKPIKD